MEEQYFTPEQWEDMKFVLMIVLAIPALFALRLLVFMILPKSVIRYLFLGKRGEPPELHKNKNRRHFD